MNFSVFLIFIFCFTKKLMSTEHFLFCWFKQEVVSFCVCLVSPLTLGVSLLVVACVWPCVSVDVDTASCNCTAGAIISPATTHLISCCLKAPRSLKPFLPGRSVSHSILFRLLHVNHILQPCCSSTFQWLLFCAQIASVCHVFTPSYDPLCHCHLWTSAYTTLTSSDPIFYFTLRRTSYFLLPTATCTHLPSVFNSANLQNLPLWLGPKH